MDKLQDYIDMGRIVPKEKSFVTMRDLHLSGLISNVKEGVKLLADVIIIIIITKITVH